MKNKFLISSLISTQLSFFSPLTINSALANNLNNEIFDGNRPTQYVAISFDGSYSLPMWEQTREKAKSVNGNFTYFLSGVYFLSRPEIVNNYVRPDKKQKGKSDIGFADTFEDIRLRLHEVLDAISEGNEMGSHVNGHYDGGKWTYSQWSSEFKQFADFILNVFKFNNKGKLADKGGKIKSLKEAISKSDDTLTEQDWQNAFTGQLKGFRAPLLARNKDTDRVLAVNHYTYDCSQVAPMKHWPNLQTITDSKGNELGKVWNFALAEIPIYGTSRKSISMDYNFYYSQSKGKPDLANSEKYEESYYQSLMNYFNTNYYGNRAPIHIGNHFSVWNNGAYFKALMRFADTVSKYSEVKIVNYSELVHVLEEAKQENLLAQWSKGNFKKLESDARVAAVANDAFFKVNINLKNETQIGANFKHLYLEGSGEHIWKFTPTSENGIRWTIEILDPAHKNKVVSKQIIQFPSENGGSKTKDPYSNIDDNQNSQEAQHFHFAKKLLPTLGQTKDYIVQIKIIATKGLEKLISIPEDNKKLDNMRTSPHELLSETRNVKINSSGLVVELDDVSQEELMTKTGDQVEAHNLTEESQITSSQLKAILNK